MKNKIGDLLFGKEEILLKFKVFSDEQKNNKHTQKLST